MKKILIVERNPDIIKSLTQLIGRAYADTKVETAQSHMTVQGFLDPRDPFDLIFWGGEIDGGDTIGLIAMARQMLPKCHMVAMSTTLMPQQVKAGCNLQIIKPFVDMDAVLIQAFPSR